MKKVIIIIGLLGILTTSYGQQQYFSKQQLNADFDSLLISIEEIHPNMFANISKEVFDLKVIQARNSIKDSMTRMEFFIIAAPVVACLQDGHTHMQFPGNDISLVQDKLFPFPVNVSWRDSTARVSDDRSEPKSGIPVGAQILEINQRPIQQILGKMYNLVSGEKVFFKNYNTEVNFTRYLYLLYHDTAFSISYKYENQIFSKIVAGIPVNQRYPSSSPVQTTPSNQPKRDISLNLKILPDSSIAIITLYYFPKDNWYPGLDSVFRAIREQKIRDLIIDIRNNGGGNSAKGDYFFQYISKVPYKQFGTTTIRTSRKQIEFHKSFYNMVDTTSIGIKHWPSGDLVPLRKTEYKFNKGNVYLLTSNNTYSSAASFSWAFKYFKMGTIVGEETGGMAVCFGDVIMQTLPNTKLDFGISHKKFYNYGATDEDGSHGTIPDFEVPSEKALDYTIKLIMNGR